MNISGIWKALTGIPLWMWAGIAAILAAAALWVTILSNQVSEGRSKVDALSKALSASQAEVEQLKNIRAADTAAALIVQAEIDAIRIKEAKRRAELDKALKANPEWASQPVPRDVADSLQP